MAAIAPRNRSRALLLTPDNNSAILPTVDVRHHAPAFQTRSSSGNARSADSSHARDRFAARMGHFRAHPADLPRRAARQPGVALPGSTPAGAPGLDQSGMGRFRVGTARAVLPPDGFRAQATESGDRNLGAPDRGNWTGDRDGVTWASPVF